MALTKYQFLYKQQYNFQNDIPLQLELTEAGIIQENGTISHNDYSGFFDWPFSKVWKELGYNDQFEKFKENFFNKAQNSVDVKRMIDIAINDHEINNLTYDETTWHEDRITRGLKLGYTLAINGDNPDINDLIFNNNYYFDDGYYYCKNDDEIFGNDLTFKILSELYHNSFARKLITLHEVCKGYLRAMIVYFLKNFNGQPVGNTIDKANQGKKKDKLTNRQQVLLLQLLGILDMPVITNLSTENQGKLFSHLLNRDEKNTKEFIRYRHGKNIDNKNSLFLPEENKKVFELLKQLGIEIPEKM